MDNVLESEEFLGSNESNMTCAEEAFTVPATLYRKIAGTFIFLIIWPFIVLDMKWFPIGRPAAAVLGATFMVLFAVVPQDQAFLVLGAKGSIQTVCLLIGMMILSYYYDREGLLRIAALWIFGRNKPFKRVLWKVCVLAACLAAVITNDATSLVLTPLLVYEHRNQKRSVKELPPLLLGIATSANIGSASSFFGNPQNAFIAANSDNQVSLLIFFMTTLPAAVLGICISISFLYVLHFRVVFLEPKTTTEGSDTTDPKSSIEHPVALHNEKFFGIQEPKDLESALEETVFVASLHASREDLAHGYDRSDNPSASSQVAYEREKLYTSEARPVHHSSRCSLQQDLPQDGTYGLELAIKSAKSTSHPNLTNGCGSTGDLTSNGAQRKTKGKSPGTLEIATSELPPLQTTEPVSGADNKEVVNTEDIWSRKWQAKLFLFWLLFVTIIVVILLAIPPPPTGPDAQFNLGLVPLGAGILTMLVDTILNKKYAHDVITKIDWSILLLFMGLFIWLRGFQNTQFPDEIFEKVFPELDLARVEGVLLFAILTVIGANIFSNVPLVILVISRLFVFPCGASTCHGQLTGVLLAWLSTISGNFTLVGSVTNLIVAEKAMKCVNFRLTFLEYLKFGFFSTLLVLFSGLPIVYFAGKNVDI